MNTNTMPANSETLQALRLIAERATQEKAQAVAHVLPSQFQLVREGSLIWEATMEAYLLKRVEALTGKHYAVPGTAFRKAASLAPGAADTAADMQLIGLGADRHQLCFFWGVILRLDQLEGPPPPDAVEFFRWCQLEAISEHVNPILRNLQNLSGFMEGRMHSSDARALLQLPETVPLNRTEIRSAYRAKAFHHHPDTGGDRQYFERLTDARDRLLQEVGS